MNHRRTGKIARLPEEIREQVNEYLSQGWEYSRIIEWLTQQGHPGINLPNLTKWKQGGYEDWLRHAERLDELELKLQYATDVALQADPAKFQQAAVNLTCLQFFELLNRFDSSALVGAIQARPEKYPSLINSLARFTHEYVALQRFRTELEDREAQRNPQNRGGISSEAVTRMLLALRVQYPAEFQALPAPETEPLKPN